MRVRKKPVEVEAVQWTGDNWEEILIFIGPSVLVQTGDQRDNHPHWLNIQTLEGIMTAHPWDWIIKGVHAWRALSLQAEYL